MTLRVGKTALLLLTATAPFAVSFVPHIVLTTTSSTTTVSSIQTLPAAELNMLNNNENDGATEMQTPTLTPSADITETMREQSIQQYSDVMDHFMCELASDMVFLQNQNDVSKYIDERFDAILFDCDGVLYRGTDAIPDAGSSLKSLLKQGKKVLFVTNNAGSNRMELRDKLSTILDCPELREDQMVSSSYSAARYLQKTFEKRGVPMKDLNVHVIGTSGLCDELRNFGATVTGGPSEDGEPSSMSRAELASYSFAKEGKIDAVVVGLDNDFNYKKLCIANVLLQKHPEALLIATNEDAYDLVGSDARHLPGNGSLVKAIECCSQRNAINVGKPSKILADLLSEEHGLDPARTLFVGDRLDTDIKFGKDGGMQSALVLTGCTTSATLVDLDSGTDDEPFPHIIFPHMGMMGLDQENN
jgi:phosphoglycolate/pyridoxal phosphate phosphatase family enzyme